MAINGVINGSEYLLLVNGKYAILGDNANFSVESATKDITVRETYGWNTSLLSSRSWVFEFTGKLGFKYSDGTLTSQHTSLLAMSPDEILEDGIINQEKFWLNLKCVTSGTPYWQGQGYLQSAEISAPNEDSSTISLSFSGVGELEQLTI